MKFKTETIDGGLRFTSHDGWADLILLDDNRANIWCGTFNGTPAEVFGSRLWHLLRDAIPDLGIRVIAYDGEVDQFVERILVNAGFTKEGTRRAWAGGGQDGVVYSILASECIHEVNDGLQDQQRTAEGGTGEDSPV